MRRKRAQLHNSLVIDYLNARLTSVTNTVSNPGISATVDSGRHLSCWNRQRSCQSQSHHESIYITLFVLLCKDWLSGCHLLHLAGGLNVLVDRIPSCSCRSFRNIPLLPYNRSHSLRQASLESHLHRVSLFQVGSDLLSR